MDAKNRLQKKNTTAKRPEPTEQDVPKQGASHKNIWYGRGRQRIEIPKSVLKSSVLANPLLKGLHVCGLGYYPKAEGHYTYRKKGLPENFLFYCVDGSGWYKIGNKEYKVQPNSFFILPAQVEHAYGSDEKHPWTIYWIHFGGEELKFLNELQVVEKHFQPGYVKANELTAQLFNKIYKTLELGYSIDNLLFVNLNFRHLLSLFLYNGRHFENAVSEKNDFVEAAIRYMQEHINENISLNELCAHYNYSVSRFSSLFKQKTGYAPIDYFIQMKMQKASQELDFTDQSIKSIAITLGFDDPYYFSRRFRKIIGVSPKKYRSLQKD